jgi:hypothetical protein
MKTPKLSKRAAVNLAMRYIIPLILGLVIIMIYLVFFSPARIIPWINWTLP